MLNSKGKVNIGTKIAPTTSNLLSLSDPASAATLDRWYVITIRKGTAKKARKIPTPVLTREVCIEDSKLELINWTIVVILLQVAE